MLSPERMITQNIEKMMPNHIKKNTQAYYVKFCK